jgi:hypothetical protein
MGVLGINPVVITPLAISQVASAIFGHISAMKALKEARRDL